MLPMEVLVPSLRVSRQNDLNPQEYSEVMMMELEALDWKRLQALDHIMIQEKKVAQVVREGNLKKGSSFGRWCCLSVLKMENWGNGLLVWIDNSRFTKYCLEMPTSYQALKGSHTKGSLMGSTSRNTFP